MKTLAKFGIPLLFVAAGYAENWNAKLLDASCYDKSATSSHSSAQTSDRKSREDLAKNCAPTAATTSYAIETSSGHVYKLDTTGNSKVASEMQSGAIKPDKDGDVHVAVSGTLQGDSVQVSNVSGKAHMK